MAKKAFIKVQKAGKSLKIFLEDLNLVHSFAPRRRPRIPAFDEKVRSRSEEDDTDIEFQPLNLA